jgi:hypothetical protein
MKAVFCFVFLVMVSAAGAQHALPANISGPLIVETAGGPRAWLNPTTATQPVKGQSLLLNGLFIRRMSDLADFGMTTTPGTGGQGGQISPTYPYDGNPQRGATNGYSKFSSVNITGRYMLAFGVQQWVVGLYDITDPANPRWMCRPVHAYKNGYGIIAYDAIGEKSDPRWDLSGRPGTENTVYYTWQGGLYKRDLITGAQAKIADWPGWTVDSEDHADQSSDATWRMVRITRVNAGVQVYKLMLANLRTGAVTTTTLCDLGKCSFDVSPSGNWCVAGSTAVFPSPYICYRPADLATGLIRPVFLPGNDSASVTLPTNNCGTSTGHDGWAWTPDGREVFVYQNNRADLWEAFDPVDAKRISFMAMKTDAGYAANAHFARMLSPARPGWVLVSTYYSPFLPSTYPATWACNQLFLCEIKPLTEHPRQIRLGNTQNLWGATTATDKGAWYFCEAFANIDPAGMNVYWGGNWDGMDNLEVYRVELPAGWWESVSAPVATPTVTPTPVPTPSPTPSPTASPTPSPTASPMPVASPTVAPTATPTPVASPTPWRKTYKLTTVPGGLQIEEVTP